ncbi:MAG: CDP-diacylglycerol--serine O-phosphatidyltransferase [Sorangiineae bacterium]|nr:CDP-diacylglycerol--serine O-phosphatidyltransferase [Polyangiaceae bacterium]MEB2321944.1 CDP-diacylglycerol--serine O-phosphatidyltransferase [Sorangiineae bacterium]
MGFKRTRRGRGKPRRRLDLRKTLFVLPNLITLASIFCGFNAIRIVAKDGVTVEDFYRAAVLLIFAMLFDMMDGRVARMTKTQSAFGLQIDSLADIVSFGVAPALLVYKWVLHRHPIAGLLTAFLFVACGAIRLARFNVLSSAPSGAPTKPGRYILGLPIPPASGILISLVVANHAVGGALGDERYTLILFAVTVVLSLLMVSSVKFRSFKDLKLDTSTVLLIAFTLGSSAFIWRRFKPEFVLVWLLGVYVLIGFIETLRLIAARLRRVDHPTVPPAES